MGTFSEEENLSFSSFASLLNVVDWPEVIRLFSCSTQMSMNIFLLINVKMPTIFLLINVKMPTIVGILTFMSSSNSILGL